SAERMWQNRLMGRWVQVGLGSTVGLAMLVGEVHDWTVPGDALDVSTYVNASPAASGGMVTSTTNGDVATSITVGPWDDSTGLQSLPYHLLIAAEQTAPPPAIRPAPDPVLSEETVWFAGTGSAHGRRQPGSGMAHRRRRIAGLADRAWPARLNIVSHQRNEIL